MLWKAGDHISISANKKQNPVLGFRSSLTSPASAPLRVILNSLKRKRSLRIKVKYWQRPVLFEEALVTNDSRNKSQISAVDSWVRGRVEVVRAAGTASWSPSDVQRPAWAALGPDLPIKARFLLCLHLTSADGEGWNLFSLFYPLLTNKL